ncbi:MAG TPA: hypothetical protein VF791_24330 [Pyrinomonadaceae bacterium]
MPLALASGLGKNKQAALAKLKEQAIFLSALAQNEAKAKGKFKK